MNRLTARIRNGTPKGTAVCPTIYGDGSGMEKYDVDEINAILAKLADYEDAEEQNRLITLPCAEGDTVYVVGKHIDVCNVVEFTISENRLSITMTYECHDSIEGCPFINFRQSEMNCSGTATLNQNCFGKTVFLTEAEARQALWKKSEVQE